MEGGMRITETCPGKVGYQQLRLRYPSAPLALDAERETGERAGPRRAVLGVSLFRGTAPLQKALKSQGFQWKPVRK